jgi:hypothetical protein
LAVMVAIVIMIFVAFVNITSRNQNKQ